MYSAKGIILGIQKIGEADVLLSIYTREYGKVLCVAQSVRKNESKLRSMLQIGNSIDAILVPLRSGRYRLTSASLSDSFGFIRADSTKLQEMQFALAVANAVIFELLPDEKLWDFLNRWLFELAVLSLDTHPPAGIRKWFLANFLICLGFSFSENFLHTQKTLAEYCSAPEGASYVEGLADAYQRFLGFSLPAGSLIQYKDK